MGARSFAFHAPCFVFTKILFQTNLVDLSLRKLFIDFGCLLAK